MIEYLCQPHSHLLAIYSTIMKITWAEYKKFIGREIQEQKHFIYRGQSNSEWTLTTSVHRTEQIKSHDDLLTYFDVLVPEVLEQIEA